MVTSEKKPAVPMKQRLQTVAAVNCMKTLLMVFNFIFWVTGIAILVIGIWMKISLHKVLEVSKHYNESAPYAFIGIGIVMIFVGFFACCCTVKGQPILLYMLGVFLFLVFILELSAGIFAYTYRTKIRDSFLVSLNATIYQYGSGGFPDEDINFMQSTLHCCGVFNYTDWADTPWGQKHNLSVPQSCCRKKACNTKHFDANDVYQMGCYSVVVDFINNNLGPIAGGVFGMAFFQLVGVILSCCLAKHINKTKYEQMA